MMTGADGPVLVFPGGLGAQDSAAPTISAVPSGRVDCAVAPQMIPHSEARLN
jgi:hypothetical protein